MNSKKTFLFLLCILSFGLFAQNTDSLGALLKTKLADTTRVQILNKLSRNYVVSNPDTAFEFARQAVELAEKVHDSKGIALSYLNIGRTYYFLSDNGKALEFSFKSLTEYEKLNDKKGIATAANNVGGIYYVQKSLSNAMTFYQRALKIYEELGEQAKKAALLGNIGGIYYEQVKYDEALKYYYTAMAILKNDPSQLYVLSTTYASIANCYWYKLDFKKALEFHFKALTIKKELNDNNGICITLANIGGMYNDLNKPDSAIKYLNEAIKMGRVQNNRGALTNAYAFLSNSYELKGDLKKANGLLRLFGFMKDSIYNSETTTKMAEVLSQYEADKKERERDLIEKAKEEIQNAKLEKQRLMTTTISVVAVLIFILLIFIFRSFKQKQKANTIINRQKELAESQKLQLEEKQKEIVDSINYAKRIQNTLLAHASYLQKHLPEHFVFFRPKDIVSGDFYWATSPKDGKNLFYLAVCDSTGHGVPGAFMSLLNISFLNEAINEKGISEPGEILNYVRKRLIKNISQDGGQDGMDGIVICLNKNTGEISYAAANNRPVLISNENFTELNCDRMPVGKSDKEESFKTYSVSAKKGDMLYLYTDGYADQFGGPKGKKFKYKALNELLVKISSEKNSVQEELLAKELLEWKGELEQVDDICVIGIKIA